MCESSAKILEKLEQLRWWAMSLPSVGRPAYELLSSEKDGAMEGAVAAAECRICQGADSGVWAMSRFV